ncbi:hypothetical protein ACSBR2_011255 [Camellia fascicularis]
MLTPAPVLCLFSFTAPNLTPLHMTTDHRDRLRSQRSPPPPPPPPPSLPLPQIAGSLLSLFCGLPRMEIEVTGCARIEEP